ncbi:MAG: hypothetical protein Q8K64_04630 [Sediminibacterium sp.]|nr:hypothetical protein [Sediminibacterium sp.]TXT34215.1 MAG: hypothetical protein FD136_440 [Chitinophagaceae bacterium]
MKGQIMPAIVQIDRQHLKELTHEVRETLATEFMIEKEEAPQAKAFTAVNLWKIQREMRSANLNFKSNF